LETARLLKLRRALSAGHGFLGGRGIRLCAAERTARNLMSLTWYQAAQIGLSRGDTLIVTEKAKTGWWKGTNSRTNLTGAFPAVYVRLESDIVRPSG
jgi:hypothetical protein